MGRQWGISRKMQPLDLAKHAAAPSDGIPAILGHGRRGVATWRGRMTEAASIRTLRRELEDPVYRVRVVLQQDPILVTPWS